MSSPRIWARLVLGGLVVWFVLTPILMGLTMLAAPSFTGQTLSLPWLNFPGPKVWGVMLLHQQDLGRMRTLADVLGPILAIVMAVAIYLLTWPRHPGSGIEPPINMRLAARWSTCGLLGGLILLNSSPASGSGMISPVWGTFAIVFVELPCTLLIYMHFSTLARRLDLPGEAVRLRRCGWISAFAMTVSVVMIIAEYPNRFGSEPYHYVLIWCYGAAVGSAAIVATGSLIRVAMALWTLATAKPAATIR